jgi:tetratricopeptide (TPR) repeat protein
MVRRFTTILIMSLLFLVSCSRETPRQKADRHLDRGRKALAARQYSQAALQFRIAARHVPKDPEPLYQLALAHLGLREGDAAITALHAVLRMDPKHVPAQIKVSDLMVASGSRELLAEAGKRIAQVLAVSPGNIDALHTRAAAELGSGKLDAAENTVTEILQKSPGHTRASVILALVKFARNDQKGAEAVLQQTLQRDPRSAEAAVALGRFYLLTDRAVEAEAQFKRAIDLEPDHSHALLQLAALRMRAGRKTEAGEAYRRLAALPERQFRAWHALFLAETGNTAAAISELEQAYKAAPADRDIRSALVQIYSDAHRVADADGILTKALTENSKDVQALLQRTQLFLDRGNVSGAERDVRVVLKYEPGSAAGHYLLSQIYRHRGEIRNSTSELRQALEFDPEMLAARLELASRLTESGAAASALELIEKAPDQDRVTLAAALQRNWALIQLKRTDEAQHVVSEILRHGQLAEAVLQQGIILLENGNLEGAKTSLTAALSQSPSDMRALKALTQVYLLQKQPAQAVAVIRQHMTKLPGNAGLHQHLAQTLAATGDNDGAREALQAAKAISPKSAAIDLDLARTEIAGGRPDSALQIVERLLLAEPNNSGACLMAAMLHDKLGNAPQAIAHYRKMLEIDPHHPLALNNLAFHLSSGDKDLDEALKYAQMAREVSPGNAAALDDTIGWILYRKGLYASAVRTLRNAVADEPNAVRRFHLAMAHFKAGDRKEAVAVYKSAVAANPDAPERAAAARLLGVNP